MVANFLLLFVPLILAAAAAAAAAVVVVANNDDDDDNVNDDLTVEDVDDTGKVVASYCINEGTEVSDGCSSIL